MSVPRGQLVSADQWVDVEDLLSLVLTTGWRRAGWVPLHAAGLIEPGRQPGRQILVCAASGGGKTTFTVALVRRGWRSLGDDKLLVRGTEPGAIEAARTEARGSEARGNRSGTIVAAIKHMLNVDPAVSDWFPELALVRSLPAYSSRTPKRRLSLAGIWPHAPAASMEPTHLVVVNRIPGPGGVRPTPIDRAAAISALLRQTVIPRDPAVARQIARTIGQLAERVSAARFDMYDDAFEDEDAIGRALDRLQ